jgi:hypothetical protein
MGDFDFSSLAEGSLREQAIEQIVHLEIVGQ